MRQTAKCAEKVGLKPIKKMAYRYTFHPDPYYIKEIREFFEDLEEDDVDKIFSSASCAHSWL